MAGEWLIEWYYAWYLNRLRTRFWGAQHIANHSSASVDVWYMGLPSHNYPLVDRDLSEVSMQFAVVAVKKESERL